MNTEVEDFDFNSTIAPYIGKTAKMLNSHVTDIFSENNIPITKQQWIILKILNENTDEGIIQNKLAFITERNKASLTRLINGMENKNLVSRVRSQKDTRKKIISTTEKGTELFLKTKPLMVSSIIKVQEGVTEEEVMVLKNILLKIQKNITSQSI